MEQFPTKISRWDFHGKKVIHLKGFARGLIEDQKRDEEIVKFLELYDVICYDGDTIAKDSYSRVIKSLVSGDSQCVIVAFVIDSNLEKFVTKCQKSYQGYETKLKNRYFVYPIQISSNLHKEKYSALGISAIGITNTKEVCSYGGGPVVAMEYEKTSHLIWHFFPHRRNNFGIVEESPLKNIPSSESFLIYK